MSGSTYSDLQSLRPSDVAEHIAAGVEDYDPNHFGPGEGLAYIAENFTGEPGGHAVDLIAIADDDTKRRFRVHIESIS